tara:strand:+ start:151 stop:417 length:267 start_codon:yes stop_codon:yes gene_type:complete
MASISSRKSCRCDAKETGETKDHTTGQADAEQVYGKTQQILQVRRARCLLIQRPLTHKDVDRKIWRESYNTKHLHSTADDIPPREYKN